MVGEVVAFLVGNVEGAYLDLTVGGGGHLKALAEVLDNKARLYGIDKDVEAVAEATTNLEGLVPSGRIVKGSFGDLGRLATRFDAREFDGILLDLGLSSHQIDDPSRGFSFQQDGPLDMRFDRDAVTTAADLVNTLDEEELKRIIREFGEERGAVRIARAIVTERQKGSIRTTHQLAAIIDRIVGPPHQTKSLARVFQSLRIALNRELEELRAVLPVAARLLVRGGRLAVIAYHSLEDRLVKRFFQQAAREPLPPVHSEEEGVRLRLITRKPVMTGEDEIRLNPRARSARLRVAERI
jgi:16S rRNA (cytosine1402-N4)-methyltransferase